VAAAREPDRSRKVPAPAAHAAIDNKSAEGIEVLLEDLDQRSVEAFVDAGEVIAVVDTSAAGSTTEPRDLLTGVEVRAAGSATLLYERRPGSNDDWEPRVDPDQPTHTDHVLTIGDLAGR
jgi:hypothetical protein